MESIIHQLSELVGGAFAQCGYEPRLGAVTLSDRMDLCQFQCNGAFEGAKLYRKAPVAIAGEVAAALAENDIFQKAEAVPPGFLNLTVTDAFLLEAVAAVAADGHAGIAQAGHNETIVLDYGGPNIAKPLHIGHLRAAIIGEALKRIARAAGYTVISDVHLGDWGLQMGLVIAELSERFPEWVCFADGFDSAEALDLPLDVDMLNEIYPFASKKSKEDEAFAEKAHNVTLALQTGHRGYRAVWEALIRVSAADLKESYEKLGVTFDYWYGESDAEPYIEPMVNILKEKNLLYLSDGAQVVDVAEESDKSPVPPVIIKKSDNSNIYATTDLATILQRAHDFSPDRIWYVVDKRQGLHFTQVFRCAKKAGLVPESTELSHLGFGTMNGSDGKPYKTRDGGVMRLSDLIETVTEAAYEKIGQSEYANAEEKRENAKKIGIAAIKFGDLVNHRSKDYIFDIDKFLSFEGKSGTYLLYTVTRINSILRKAGTEESAAPFDTKQVFSDAERALYLAVLMTTEAFRLALQEKAPNYVCENAYLLATLFSAFYHDSHILNEADAEKKAAWLSLCVLVRRLLLLHLDVLGIEAVDRM
ncbi:MAG: arginine--tRNA ligase [Oscillospiraceae bacterium]|jgi:arginyl-tRNA synthetase|nr:arginine--tRNA ligase [Oscillospiraceae bacterium]